MNLHILSDSKFSETFYSNIKSLGLLNRNKFVVRSNHKKLKHISHDLPAGSPYSREFNEQVGDTLTYDHIFIHQFSPLMYRWVAMRSFKSLNWCVWGADLYNLPRLSRQFYEPETWKEFSKNNFRKNDFLYTVKLYATNMLFQSAAYKKVDHVLTWMQSEFMFAKQYLPLTKATWKFFFYENHVPYEKLDELTAESQPSLKQGIQFILGNSGTDTNNHIDAVREISRSGIKIDLIIPVSYGQDEYVRFLKKNLSFYKEGAIEYLEKFMNFEDYLSMLNRSDGLIMNHLRPQGYGNIFMMMYLNKPVFLNSNNISLPDLNRNHLKWLPLEDIGNFKKGQQIQNKNQVQQFLSHEKLQAVYTELFR
jgi:dTDP-N-acetylfucosamine:lipid II N-acetylfucosaminyltransferase